MEPVNKPQWSGITIETGNERHVLPLYEPEGHITLGPDCPCAPDVAQAHRPEKFAPPLAIYTHHNLKHQQ